MDDKIINTLVGICENDEDYTMVYTPAQNIISLVCTSDFENEILCIEKISDKEYKFESKGFVFTDIDIDFIISNIYNTLLNLKFESFIEDSNINGTNDFNRITDIVNHLREEYC